MRAVRGDIRLRKAVERTFRLVNALAVGQEAVTVVFCRAVAARQARSAVSTGLIPCACGAQLCEALATA